MDFVGVFWYWAAGLLLLFLPVELYAAKKKTGGTFSEFIWWAFGIKQRAGGSPVRYAGGRHVVLLGMCAALLAHFGFGTSVVPVIAFGVPVGVVMIRAILWERNP